MKYLMLVLYVIGQQHGGYAPDLASCRRALAWELSQHPGWVVQDKGCFLADQIPQPHFGRK